jgi:hypothetical protein
MVGAGFYKQATPTEFGIGPAQIEFGSKPNRARQPTPEARLDCISASLGPALLRFALGARRSVRTGMFIETSELKSVPKVRRTGIIPVVIGHRFRPLLTELERKRDNGGFAFV